MDAGSVVCLMLCAFWWGEWFANRKAERERKSGDAALKLLASMVTEILGKRKFVGRGMEIIREEHFELFGERFSVAVKAAGDHALIEHGTNA